MKRFELDSFLSLFSLSSCFRFSTVRQLCGSDVETNSFEFNEGRESVVIFVLELVGEDESEYDGGANVKDSLFVVNGILVFG